MQPCLLSVLCFYEWMWNSKRWISQLSVNTSPNCQPSLMSLLLTDAKFTCSLSQSRYCHWHLPPTTRLIDRHALGDTPKMHEIVQYFCGSPWKTHQRPSMVGMVRWTGKKWTVRQRRYTKIGLRVDTLPCIGLLRLHYLTLTHPIRA